MPLYDYHCSQCNETWEAVRRMDDRKIPESEPCPKCFKENCVEQTIVNTNIGLNYTLESTRAMKKLSNSKLQDKFTQIHQNTPGSILDKTSTITPVSK